MRSHCPFRPNKDAPMRALACILFALFTLSLAAWADATPKPDVVVSTR